MERVVESNEQVQLDFAEPLPDKLSKDANTLVADKLSKLPTAMLVQIARWTKH